MKGRARLCWQNRGVKTAAAILFWVALWWLIALLFQKPLILPTPPAVLLRLFQLLATREFLLSVLRSLLTLGLGILAAFPTGALLAMLTLFCKPLEPFVSTPLHLSKTTPVASVIFLLLLFVGRSKLPLFMAFWMALPIFYANMREGLQSTDKDLLEMAAAFGVPSSRVLFSIRIPALLPHLKAACRTAPALAFKAGIAAEILAIPEGSIGRAIYESKLFLETTDLFAFTLTVILLGLLIEGLSVGLLTLLERRKRHVKTE